MEKAPIFSTTKGENRKGGFSTFQTSLTIYFIIAYGTSHHVYIPTHYIIYRNYINFFCTENQVMAEEKMTSYEESFPDVTRNKYKCCT